MNSYSIDLRHRGKMSVILRFYTRFFGSVCVAFVYSSATEIYNTKLHTGCVKLACGLWCNKYTLDERTLTFDGNTHGLAEQMFAVKPLLASSGTRWANFVGLGCVFLMARCPYLKGRPYYFKASALKNPSIFETSQGCGLNLQQFIHLLFPIQSLAYPSYPTPKTRWVSRPHFSRV